MQPTTGAEEFWLLLLLPTVNHFRDNRVKISEKLRAKEWLSQLLSAHRRCGIIRLSGHEWIASCPRGLCPSMWQMKSQDEMFWSMVVRRPMSSYGELPMSVNRAFSSVYPSLMDLNVVHGFIKIRSYCGKRVCLWLSADGNKKWIDMRWISLARWDRKLGSTDTAPPVDRDGSQMSLTSSRSFISLPGFKAQLMAAR